MWFEHIEEWAQSRGSDPEIVEGILLREGWEPDQYKISMKQDLFYWLDQWYTLSNKSLPKPATALKRNPSCRCNSCGCGYKPTFYDY